MARPKANITVLDPGSGKARPGAWVSFYLANTSTLAQLYADDDVSSLANPVQANQLGQVAVRVNPGLYDISMTWDGAQPTVVEDVLAYTPEGAVLQSPGDMLVMHPSGTPTRLPVGLPYTVLVSDAGMPAWHYLQSGKGLWPAPAGSLLHVRASDGVVVGIPPGVQDQALAMAGGTPTWVSTLLPPGTTLPINQPGDLVTGAPSTGLPARLAAGPAGSTLTVGNSNTLVWSEPGAVGPGEGQCYLTYENVNSLWLTPYQGNKIWVNGGARTIPDGGIRLAPTGLAPFAAYYIYLAWTGSALQLEASSTGFQQTGGLWHKSGDLSRSLVGFAYVHDDVGTPAWRETSDTRGVLSLFHQDERTAQSVFTAPRSTSSPTPVELHQEIRTYFIAWGFTNVTMTMTGTAYSNVSGVGFTSLLALDGVAVAGTHTTAVSANVHLNIATVVTKALPAWDGLHWITVHGLAQSGTTATWHGEPGGLLSCRTGVTIAS
jgi:hypothetical protein